MKLNLDKVPKNLTEAIQLIKVAIENDGEKKHFNNPVSLHFGFGMWLRNNWSLWDKETPLVQWFVKNLGIVHADDISGTILEGLAFELRGEVFDAIKHVEYYKSHWKSFGIDPATQLKLKTN